jgi:hypothetical protein
VIWKPPSLNVPDCTLRFPFTVIAPVIAVVTAPPVFTVRLLKLWPVNPPVGPVVGDSITHADPDCQFANGTLKPLLLCWYWLPEAKVNPVVVAPVTCPPLLLMMPPPAIVTPGAVVSADALKALPVFTISVPAIVPVCVAVVAYCKVKVAVALPKVSDEPAAIFKFAVAPAPAMLSVWLAAELLKVGLVLPLTSSCDMVCVGTLITAGVPPKVNCNTSVALG